MANLCFVTRSRVEALILLSSEKESCGNNVLGLKRKKQGGDASMRPWQTNPKLSNVKSCIIPSKGGLHARRALSECERGACPA
eukprot:2878851-Pleurochrysis_carterae.AAC.1